MIIDTHSQLVTKEAIESLPEEMARGYQLMFRDMKVPDITDTLKDMGDAGVDMSVIVAIDAETTFNYRVSNDLVAEMVGQYPDKFIGFASVDPHKGVIAATELDRAINDLGLKGLKVLPHLNKANPNDPVMYPLYEIAQDAGIPVLFHTGTQFHAGTKIKYCMPIYLDDVAVDFPRMKIVMAHFGYPWFYEGMSVVLRNPNVFFNIAGWAPRRIPDEVIRQMNGPLAAKCLFGSDYPLLSRVRIMNELDKLPLKEGIKDLLVSENPKRLLGIGVAECE